MTTRRFISVFPEEISRYGPAGAVVLAHVRYRCASDGPGRIDRDGQRWWRASQSVISREVGLSVKGVRTALQTLGDAITANHFPPLTDQSLAYRPTDSSDSPDLPVAENGEVLNGSDLPVAEKGASVAELDEVPRRYGRGTSPISATALPPEELGEGGRSAAAPPAQMSPPEVPPPLSQSATSNGNDWRSRCVRHAHIKKASDVPPCVDCGALREAAEDRRRAAADRKRDRDAEIRKAIDDCDCDDVGRLEDLTDCPKHPNFRQRRRAVAS